MTACNPDINQTADHLGAAMTAGAPVADGAKVVGRYTAVCRDADGKELWRDEFDNLVTTAGKNFLLDSALAGSSYSATEYIGLISSTSWSAVVAADTMASHAGWLESGGANAPTMSSTRQTCAWSSASAGVKALSAGLTFTFTGSGTVQGAFIVGGTGAVSTVANTSGTLYSGGVLSGGAQPVISGNTLTVSYSTTLT
jgi:hypothetical protein